MKITTSLLLSAAVLTSGWLAAAPQDAGSDAIAFVNGDRVLEGSSIGQQARERLDAAASTWQQRISTAQQELDALQRNRSEQALTLNDTALARLNQDIEEKQVEIDRLNDDARRELTRLEQQVTLDVNSQLGPLVERFAAERGIDVIFDGARLQGVLFVDESRDLTDDFLALVNATVSTGQQ
jgi:Skp family chaperone for outer membrane proteins